MIKLYIDIRFSKPSKSYYTFPLLEQLENKNSEIHRVYKRIDNISLCDYVILPVSIEYLYTRGMRNLVNELFSNSRKHGKPVLIFSGGDYGVTIKRDDVYTVRLGGFHSKMDNRTLIMPPFIKDPYVFLNTDFFVLPKTQKPSIGFVGHANASYTKYFRELLLFAKGNLNRILKKDVTDCQRFYPSSHYRVRYLTMIQKDLRIDSNFVFRQKYRAGVITEVDKNTTTLEFYESISENLFTFCMRGTGNFSVRFYETLAMGRIPVLVDTDCRLPFSDDIDWKAHCVVVKEDQIGQLMEHLLVFYQSHTERELQEIQRKNRDLWHQYFLRDSYFKGIAKILKYSLKNKL